MLVDTSVWIDHLRRGNRRLEERLHAGEVWTHPFVIGELACGQLRRRSEILALIAALPRSPVVDHDEAMAFVESRRLAALGIGWIDVHLLASAAATRISIWTQDRRLETVADRLGLLAKLA